jgi:protein-tyrosine-phosphatase/DNA-binding transcriptional ArsR family regulator
MQSRLEECMSSAFTLAQPPNFLKLVAHDLRWRTLSALTHSDYRVQELTRLLGVPQNLISYHLKQLRDAQLVTERRSAADGRDVYYSVDLERFRQLYYSAGEALHPSLAPMNGRPHEQDIGQSAYAGLPSTRVLFLCTHNSARSQMAEAIMRQLGKQAVDVFSAGSHPSHVHPEAIRAMSEIGIDISTQCSKGMEPFVDQEFDYIITVCDRVREACPVFPGDPEHIHWSFPDPATIESEEERRLAFKSIANDLSTRIRLLLSLIEGERARK